MDHQVLTHYRLGGTKIKACIVNRVEIEATNLVSDEKSVEPVHDTGQADGVLPQRRRKRVHRTQLRNKDLEMSKVLLMCFMWVNVSASIVCC